MTDSDDRSEEYWARVCEVAAARPELAPERQDQLAAVVRQSRQRRRPQRPKTTQAIRTIRS